MTRRGRERSGRWERLLFSVMGPPQLGDARTSSREVPPPEVTACPKCGQPYDLHEIVRSPRLTWTKCPGA
jgi:hypothetical protein